MSPFALTFVSDGWHPELVWNADAVRALRERLGLDQSSFARLIGVDARTTCRWEAGTARPTGAAEAVLNGIRESLDQERSAEVVEQLVKAAAIGGLAYLIFKLLSERK